jgi:hypothetical protein
VQLACSVEAQLDLVSHQLARDEDTEIDPPALQLGHPDLTVITHNHAVDAFEDIPYR